MVFKEIRNKNKQKTVICFLKMTLKLYNWIYLLYTKTSVGIKKIPLTFTEALELY